MVLAKAPDADPGKLVEELQSDLLRWTIADVRTPTETVKLRRFLAAEYEGFGWAALHAAGRIECLDARHLFVCRTTPGTTVKIGRDGPQQESLLASTGVFGIVLHAGAFELKKRIENMSKQFDVIVIGGGPGGYIAAIRAAQLGFNVACIDEWKNAKGGPALGGTCTNVGCIPSKALLQSSEHYEQAGHHFADHGIEVKGLSLDVAKMLGRKDTVVKQNNDGIVYLFKKNKVTFFHGRGSFAAAKDGLYDVKVAGAAEETISGKHIIVATGSNARALPGAPFDEENILSNDGALRIGAVPKKLGLIGSGVIGLEMGSVWRRLGAEVTVLEGLPTFLGAVDQQIAKEAHKAFTKQGLKIELGAKVGEIKSGKKGVSVAYVDAKGQAQTLEVDKLIVSIGRVANTIGLAPEAVGLKLDERGAVVVDDAVQDQPAQRLGHRRRGARPHAGAQGRGRGRRGCRAHRRPARPRQLQHHSLGDLHQPRDRMGGPDGRAAQGRRPRLQGRHLPLHGQRPRARWATPPAWSRCWPTPPPMKSWACTSSGLSPAN